MLKRTFLYLALLSSAGSLLLPPDALAQAPKSTPQNEWKAAKQEGKVVASIPPTVEEFYKRENHSKEQLYKVRDPGRRWREIF
jgi:hypothetical protein